MLTWFPARRRGFAMAVRQTSVPLGTAAAAVGLPVLVDRAGVPAAFAGLATVCLVAALATAVWIREPPGRPAGGGPAAASTGAVLRDRRLQRLSLAGGLLVVPQFLGSVLTVELLHTGRGMAAGTAATLLSLTQVLGAAGRLGNGVWSDRAGRLRPLRIVASAIAVGFALAASGLRGGTGAGAGRGAGGGRGAGDQLERAGVHRRGRAGPAGPGGDRHGHDEHGELRQRRRDRPLGGAVAAAAGWPAMLAVGTVAALAALAALHGLREAPAPSARVGTY